MPLIPRYNQQVGMPDSAGGVPIDPNKAAEPFVAQAKIGEALAGVGTTIQKYQEEEDRWTRAIKGAEIENGIKSDTDAFAESIKGLPSSQIDEARDNYLSTLPEKYKLYGQDPVLNKSLQMSLYKGKFEAEHVARVTKAKVMSQEADGQLQIYTDGLLKEWVAADPADRPMIEQVYKQKVLEFQPDPGKAQHLLTTFGAKADEAHFETILEADPKRALMEASDPANYTRVDAVKRANYVKRAMVAMREQHAVQQQEQKNVQEQNYAEFLGLALKKNEANKVLTYTDLNNFLASKGHDPANGILAMSPPTIEALRNNIRVNQNERDALGRRQPEMNESKWVQYGQLLDGIGRGQTTYGDIAKQTARMPDHIVGSLMGQLSASGKAGMKAEKDRVWKYVNSYKGMFGNAAFAETQNDIATMMNQGDTKPDEWLSKSKAILEQRATSSGNFSGIAFERLHPGQTYTPPQAQPTPIEKKNLSGNLQGNTFTLGNKSYPVKNGEVIIDGKRFKVNQLQ
jgi:hypothetical protein